VSAVILHILLEVCGGRFLLLSELANILGTNRIRNGCPNKRFEAIGSD
jgi:hypothetical protein